MVEKLTWKSSRKFEKKWDSFLKSKKVGRLLKELIDVTIKNLEDIPYPEEIRMREIEWRLKDAGNNLS